MQIAGLLLAAGGRTYIFLLRSNGCGVGEVYWHRRRRKSELKEKEAAAASRRRSNPVLSQGSGRLRSTALEFSARSFQTR